MLADIRGRPKPTQETSSEVVAARAHGHPGPAEYVRIAVVLAVVTVVEVSVYYADALRGALVPILVALSALKFSLVVLWFMHLKFDSRLFSNFFVGGLLLAAAVFLVALATLGVLPA